VLLLNTARRQSAAQPATISLRWRSRSAAYRHSRLSGFRALQGRPRRPGAL